MNFTSIVLTAILSLGSLAFAEEAKIDKEDWTKQKQFFLQNIDKHMAAMQEAKSCITQASSKEAMKACHEKLETAHKDMRMEQMQHRKEFMEKRMQKMQENMKDKKSKGE